MRATLLVLLCCLSSFSLLKSQQHQLSNQAEISLITCAPGEELYSLFGHSALRVTDPAQNMDWVFNYGTFDFDTPFFYIKYSQARLDYLLSKAHYDGFIKYYEKKKRSVYAQKLLLDSVQKQQLFNALLRNYQPENRTYRYESFTDNCTTRIDNIIKNTIKGKWKYHNPQANKFPPTYRTSYAPYLANSDWINLGLNIILGAPMDEPIKSMFLPDIMKDSYEHTTLNGNPIANAPQTLYDAKYTYSKTPFLLSPVFILYAVAFLLLISTVFINKKLIIIDFALFLILGLIGCLILFLWFATDHSTTANNWNILWALPTHLIMAFVLLFQKRKTKFTHYYFLFTFLTSSILLLFMVFPLLFSLFNYLPGGFPFEPLIPILLCIIFRSLGIVRKKM